MANLKHCPWCGADGGALLGPLGRLTWFRCIYCGGQFSKTKTIGKKQALARTALDKE